MKHKDCPIHSAEEALAAYLVSKDLRIIDAIPVNCIDRFDVWQCVFKDKELAYRALQIKELCSLFAGEEWAKMSGMFICSILLQMQEWEIQFRLSVKEALEFIISFYGRRIIKELSERAEWFIKTREEITEPYIDKTGSAEWINKAKDLKKIIDSYAE